MKKEKDKERPILEKRIADYQRLLERQEQEIKQLQMAQESNEIPKEKEEFTIPGTINRIHAHVWR